MEKYLLVFFMQHLTVYTAKNATEWLQVVNFSGLLQLLNKLQQACQFYQIATSNCKSVSVFAAINSSLADLLQLVETSCNKSVKLMN